MKLILSIIFSISIFFSSCLYTHKVETKGNYYKLDSTAIVDTSIVVDILPYKQKINGEMSVVIGQLENELIKEQPVSNMGNWAADAMSDWANHKSHKIDFVVLNYGGLRLESIGKGSLNKGKIFELMPFDNSLVIVTMKGSELNDLFNHILTKGGWPISKELNINFSKIDNKLESKISGESVNPLKLYNILTIDYLANGGDNCTFFKGKKSVELGILLRTAMIEQLEFQNKNGIKITAKKDDRILIKP